MYRLLRLFLVFGLFFISAGAFAQAQEPPVTILTYGDSLMAGYGLEKGQDLASVLEARLSDDIENIRVINASVSGETTAGGLARLDWTLDGLKHYPDLVILALGANDMLRGLPPAQAKANLQTMIDRFRGEGMDVLLAGMRAAPNLGPDYEQRFNAIYPALAAANDGVALYPFLLEDVATNPALNQGDGIHPNEAGVKVIADKMKPAILAILNEQDL